MFAALSLEEVAKTLKQAAQIGTLSSSERNTISRVMRMAAADLGTYPNEVAIAKNSIPSKGPSTSYPYPSNSGPSGVKYTQSVNDPDLCRAVLSGAGITDQNFISQICDKNPVEKAPDISNVDGIIGGATKGAFTSTELPHWVTTASFLENGKQLPADAQETRLKMAARQGYDDDLPAWAALTKRGLYR